MDKTRIESIRILDEIIIGRVEPYIYAFTTNTVPNYLKVGDTYRPISKRLNEWKVLFPDLKKEYTKKAIIDGDTYFRDYSIHQFLENDLKKKRLLKEQLSEDIYYSKEFFKNTSIDDLDNAILDIKESYQKNTGKYEYYNSKDRLPVVHHYKRGKFWKLRPNQSETVKNFRKAINSGRRNLLMYAVMRFGKSFTSLCCALEMKAKLVLVVSAKADVKEEWKKTVESAGNFSEYVFLEAIDLEKNVTIIEDSFNDFKNIVLFLTLQDLQGDEIKEKHKQLFDKQIDLLIVDETHFGARANSYGQILRNAGYDVSDEKNIEKLDDEKIDEKVAITEIKKINAKIRLHLSGTPYRILMGSEFEKEDIISFVQFSDIVSEQEKWDYENLHKDEVNEWDNPYYGFPQMVRFAFNPNKASMEKMEALKSQGVTFAFSKLFEPISIKKDNKNKTHTKFINEKEILELLQVIDGSKQDENLLSFLDYDKIKEGNMCRHIVMVLPYCASCDAMERLVNSQKSNFKNLSEYKIVNISGLDSSKKYKKPLDIKNTIKYYESNNQKTITLTVNRMLTGSTIEEWDTMLYFKDTESPQEYDQSIFRIQNQYIRELHSENGTIKENLKHQTLLVDFDPNRLFKMQEQKSLIYNVNTDENGNSKLKERIEEELRISPVIIMNHNKIREVTATDILDIVSEYNNQRSVSDEVEEIPVDLGILDDKSVMQVIEMQAEFKSKQGLTVKANRGEGEDLDFGDDSGENDKKKNKDLTIKDSEYDYKTKDDKEIRKLESQIKTYYQRILFFSFLTKDKVRSLDDILSVIHSKDNTRLARNLFLEKDILQKVSSLMDPFKRSSLDYKIQNISKLALDESLDPLTRAMISIKKFNRMSESEVITPEDVCSNVINLIPKEGLEEIIEKRERLLDIGTKSGEFAVALYKKLTSELGYSHDSIKDLIYALPTSSIAYEFTVRFFEILGLNTDNIATKFDAYDLAFKITEDKNNYKKISSLLRQNKKFSELNLTNENRGGNRKLKFGAIVGNPPYNVSDGGAQASGKPIYQHFVMLGKEMTNRFSSFITPTRWFAGGKGLDDFRDLMLNDKTIVELHDFLTPEDIFHDTNNRGGVCYFLTDSSKTSDETRVVSYRDGDVISDDIRKLKTLDIDIFIRDKVAVSLLDKIFFNDSVENLSKIVSSRKPFGIESNIIKTEKFSLNSGDFSNPVKCIGRNKVEGFVDKSEILNNTDWIDRWKVFVPRANNIGTELNDDNLNVFISEPNSICTEAYMVIGANLDLNRDSVNNLIKYMQTKFVRYLHGQAKASHDASKRTYRFVPLQNFGSTSDIDWNCPVDQIDNQLFEKYELSTEEKEHIRKSIKDMN